MNHEDSMTVLQALTNCPEDQREGFMKNVLPNSLLREELTSLTKSWKEKINVDEAAEKPISKSFSEAWDSLKK